MKIKKTKLTINNVKQATTHFANGISSNRISKNSVYIVNDLEVLVV